MSISHRIIRDPGELTKLAEDWDTLVSRSAHPELAQTPLWQLAWLRAFGEGRQVRVAAFYEKNRLIGLAPLIARKHVYDLGLPFQRLELMGTGEDEADEVCSDYVGVIAERGSEPGVARELCALATSGELGDWDELVFGAMDGSASLYLLLAEALEANGMSAQADVTTACPYIPLPTTFEAYLESLPTARRHLARRSLRDFEKWAGGPPEVTEVTDRASLARGREILVTLHGERWAAARKDGAFGSTRFRDFHDEIMPKLLDAGALELTWITAHDAPIAALYSFVWDNRVLCYQTGRKRDLPTNVRAGLVVQLTAIKRAIEKGRTEYDFLAGTARYKMELALATRPLVRLRATKPSLREATRRAMEAARMEVRALRDHFLGARSSDKHKYGFAAKPTPAGA